MSGKSITFNPNPRNKPQPDTNALDAFVHGETTQTTKEPPIEKKPLAEQHRIVNEFNALQAEVDELKRLQSESAIELEALLPSVLSRAFAAGL
jgi:hypothetical protein